MGLNKVSTNRRVLKRAPVGVVAEVVADRALGGRSNGIQLVNLAFVVENLNGVEAKV